MSAPTLHTAGATAEAGTADAVEHARDAVARESWAEAYALLHAQDLHPTRALTATDLSALADAAWWSGHVDESVAARLRAHSAYVAADDHRGAGLEAWWLHYEYAGLGRPAAAAGWLHRARHHLEGLPDCPEQCFLAWTDAEEALAHGDPAGALAASDRMTRLAVGSGSPDLLALSRQAASSTLLAQGRRGEALSLLDDAICAATAGELSGMVTGWLYCLALTQCMEAADFPRAVEWTNAAMEWCAPPWAGRPPEGDGEPVPVPATVPSGENPFRGVCRAHRVDVLDLLGSWALAEAEARQACREVPADCLESAAAAYYAAGDVQRRQGRLDAATHSYAHAHELGRIPQPGLALLRLAQGRTDAAVAGLRLALACWGDSRHDLLGRSRLLGATTEVALAVGDVPGAAEAADELDVLAGDVPLLRAMADTARGAVALAGTGAGTSPGTPAHERALPLLRRALAGWLELRVPYEAAQVRMLLAAADRAVGDEEAARLELAAARTVFERLGAEPDARRAAALLSGGKRRRLPGGLTAREAEVLRLVAEGGTNKDIAQALVISEHTVSRHLNNIFAKLGVGSRAAATAYAYAHDLV
ncbi:LuxR C-terminal-related transcriptional regulator [Streptomyces narbonensis]|uniref:LuxR C-terminal-related transcriptional regulator n=1 Tax=Streptomyces narbonensis TaxID=67333 RepID=A0ABV3C1Z2_9ACTN